MIMKDLSTPIIDKARFHQELWLDIGMASSPCFPPMEVLDWDNALREFQHKVIVMYRMASDDHESG